MSKFRASECRAVAEQALRLAAGAHTPEAKHTYVRLAALWHGLADHLRARENAYGQPDLALGPDNESDTGNPDPVRRRG